MRKKIFLLLFILISFSSLAEQQLFSLHGLQGLAGVKKKDGRYGIQSMKANYIKDDTLVELLPASKTSSSNNFVAVRNLEEPHEIYFISKKWFAKGAVKLLKDDNTNPPSYVEQFEVDPNKVMKTVEQELAGKQDTCDIDGSNLKDSKAPTKLSSQELKVIKEDKQPQKSIWRDLYAIRNQSLSEGLSSEECMKKVDAEYDARHAKGEVMWSKYSVKEKLRRIDIHARHTFNEMKEKTANEDYESDARLAPEIEVYGPAVAKCISYHESKNLEPQYVNYNFCRPYVSKACTPPKDKCFSTANGLMQITKTTFNGMRNAGKIPLLVNSEYNSLNGEEVYKDKFNGDVSLQLESFYHVLSEKTRILKWMVYESEDKEKEFKKRDKDGDGVLDNYEILMGAVSIYDSDNESEYMEDFEQCLSCYDKEKKSDAQCYCQMRNHDKSNNCKSLLKNK